MTSHLRMPRYFFEITDRTAGRAFLTSEAAKSHASIIAYKDGRTFRTPEAAKAYAAVIASELAVEDGWVDYAVSVKDKDGNELARIPILPR
jgi:hypothetical protein